MFTFTCFLPCLALLRFVRFCFILYYTMRGFQFEGQKGVLGVSLFIFLMPLCLCFMLCFVALTQRIPCHVPQILLSLSIIYMQTRTLSLTTIAQT